jgi:hypothetical protein
MSPKTIMSKLTTITTASTSTLTLTDCSYLIPRHQGKVNMLEQDRKFGSSVPGISPDPPEHGLVDGPFRRDEELLAGNEGHQLKLGEPRKIFGGFHHPLEMLQNEGFGVNLKNKISKV